jgi:hypothetical protein
MAALSQLSYGPNLLANSSGEIEVIGPIDAEFLVVVCAAQAKMNLRSSEHPNKGSCQVGRGLLPNQTMP